MPQIAIEDLMKLCIESGASDIHLGVGAIPAMRQNTQLLAIEGPNKLTSTDMNDYLKSIAPEHIQTEFNQSGSGNFSFKYRDNTRFRVAVFKERGNCTMVLRRIPSKILDVSEIGLPPTVFEICQRARGLFLITGPTGSGKTTTLASLIDYINTNFAKHVITFEDPIEYYHVNKQSIIHQREIGADVPSFPEALRRGLRQDPDIILVGEMRDLETIRAAVSAAETGHMVFATLHTSGAASTINRIIDAFPADEQEHIRVQIAGSLTGVLSQTLCTRSDKDGMVAAYEFLYVTPGIQNMIRTNRPFQIDGDIQSGRKLGMQLLDVHLTELVYAGKISAQTTIEKSHDPRAMMQIFPTPE